MSRTVGRRRRADSGFATTVVISLSALVLMLGAVTVGIAALVVAHRRAQSAADLAALAGASARQHGSDACTAAGAIAADNHGRLVGCDEQGYDVVVRVAVRAPPLPGLPGDMIGAARAGPVATSGF